MSPRKRTKALLKELWDLQSHDVPMTAASLVEVKYQLRSCKRSVCIDILTPKPRSNVLDPVPFNFAEEAIPKFILCQLYDQKLIESRNYQDTIALPAVLSVISLVFASENSTRKFAFPTQFRWQCSRTHRTHIIFAYLDVKMRSKVYGVEELLNLRNSACPDILSTVASRDNDLSDMLRNKSRASSRSYSVNSLKRGPKRITDDSSTASDEVLFKGTRRQLKSESILAIAPPQAPLNARPTESIDSVMPTQPARPLQAIATQTKAPPIPTTDPEQPTEWKYRGRSGSEITSNEPLSAPTGLDAQHHEGFQRFFKAVVSPTHVRVTAGGRIVPNTRNPVSPTAKRPRDEETVVNGEQPDAIPAAAAAAAAQKQPAAPIMGMPHPMPFFFPGFPGMPAIHPMTGMPVPVMQAPGFPFPMAMPPAAATNEHQPKKAEDKEPKPGVKISPPEQFDHSKPFMYNGQQWMFPMFPGHFPGFMGMPPPGYGGPHVPGAPMMMPPPMAMGPMMGPMGPMSMQPNLASAQPAPPAPASSRQSTPSHPSKPPISSIRPSQISRKQIDGLKANLKYHEDQLHFNKHQIDEKDMLNKIQMLQADIDRFERVYQCQVEYEEKHYPKSDHMKEEVLSTSGRSSAPSTKTSQSQSEESKESKATTVSMNSQQKLRKKDRSRDSVGLNSNKSSTASYSFEDGGRGQLLGAMTLGKKSTLPSGAALAPIFQPRMVSASAVPTSSKQTKPWQSTTADEVLSQEQLAAVEEKLVAAGSKAWAISQPEKEHSRSPNQRFSPQHNGDLGVPYLVGTLPRGSNLYSSQRIEYDYNRQLTNEERQARYLYWGKASRSARQGLPKYDGKNFYLASPVKHDVSPATLRVRAQNGEHDPGYGFSGSVGKETDPFQSATPSQTFSGAQETILTSNSPSVKSEHSFHSQAENHDEEFAKALAETESVTDEEGGTHSKGVSETKSADYHDPRANGASSKLWQNMLKRGLTSSDVLPSTVSSTTAQGFLPQFVSNTAASLSPSISGVITSPKQVSPSKATVALQDSEVIAGRTSTFMTQKTSKTCPPAAGERLSDTLLNMVGMKAPAWAN